MGVNNPSAETYSGTGVVNRAVAKWVFVPLISNAAIGPENLNGVIIREGSMQTSIARSQGSDYMCEFAPKLFTFGLELWRRDDKNLGHRDWVIRAVVKGSYIECDLYCV